MLLMFSEPVLFHFVIKRLPSNPQLRGNSRKVTTHFSSVWRIICFSISSGWIRAFPVLRFCVVTGTIRQRNVPSQIITAFSMACSSSRILPNQGCSVSFSRAELSRRKAGFPYCLQKRVMKRSASGIISSGRSRSAEFQDEWY